MTRAQPFRTKRVYDPPASDDGLRVLVDRLWPRGLTKEKAHLDLWLKDISPSDELRRRLHGDPRSPEARWRDFRAAYDAELQREPALTAVKELQELAHKGAVTLLFGARDETYNNAEALKAFLDGDAA